MDLSNQQPSPSSQGVTLLRAISQFEKHPALRNPDYLAKEFLSPTHARLLKIARPWWAKPVLNRIHPGAYGYQISRIHFGDEALVDALDDGVKQVVILGAGNDTRAHRFEDRLKESKVRLIELDIPQSQAWKTKKVGEAFGAMPGHVTYIPIDFNKTTLEEALLDQDSAPYDPSLKTLFFWEGVSYYLDAQAVDNVLAFVRDHSPAGSLIVFDYLHQGVLEGRVMPFGAKETLEKTEKRGEPFTFGIEEDEIGSFLEKRGLEMLIHMSPEESTAKYLAPNGGKPLVRQHEYMRMVKAKTL